MATVCIMVCLAKLDDWLLTKLQGLAVYQGKVHHDVCTSIRFLQEYLKRHSFQFVLYTMYTESQSLVGHEKQIKIKVAEAPSTTTWKIENGPNGIGENRHKNDNF